MKDYYQENHKKYHEQTAGIDPASFLSPLVRCLTPGSRILDVGCGSGRDMRWLKDRGFQPTGFERSSGPGRTCEGAFGVSGSGRRF